MNLFHEEVVTILEKEWEGREMVSADGNLTMLPSSIVDEMIDESRDDYIDNDGDWSLADDVGINGDQSGGIEAGVNDMAPTSGSGTGFPGSRP